MFIWHSKLFLMQLLHFSFSFLVICLVACTIKCPHTEAVLLFTATFQTTDGHLLTICFGTAPRESKQSWSFFLLNLRQALLHYCSEVRDCRRLVFLWVIDTKVCLQRFHSISRSQNIYTVSLHILRNLVRTRLKTVTPFLASSRSVNGGICEFEDLLGEKSIVGREKRKK